jgi:4-amino-4-deoxy-L-arabinose transferase-like glycosyltransferase
MNQTRTRGGPGALFSKWWFPPLLIASIYLACILFVDPRGEFPLNDDWAYTRSAFRLASGEGLRIDEWSAPSLVGQAVYGGLLARCFGRHFLVLRLSTLALSCGIALLLWFTLARLETPSSLAWVTVLSWIFNPIQFWLSFTFMTEVPFLFFVALGTYLFLRFASSGNRWALVACGAAFGYAFLIRQTSLLFIAVVLVLLAVVGKGTTLRERVIRATAFGLTAGAFVTAFQVWALRGEGATPAVQRKFELLRNITQAQLNGNFFGILSYLSFMTIPVWIYLLPRLYRLCREAGATRSLLVSGTWGAIASYGFWWFSSHSTRYPYLPGKAFHAQMPYLLNVLYDTGLGPVTLDPTYYGPAATPVHPGLWFVITIMTAAGVVILGSIFTFGTRAVLMRTVPSAARNLVLFSLLSALAVTAFEVIFSHREEGGLFDRHVLTVALPVLLLAAILGRDTAAGAVRQPGAAITTRHREHPAIGFPAGLAVAAVLAWFSVFATHDYMAWNRLRWQLGNDLLEQGVDPLTVSGGFEFNAWHNYDTFRARGNIRKVYYWWYDDLEYLITMEPQERYCVRHRLEYYSWLHRRSMPVYLLQRISEDCRP